MSIIQGRTPRLKLNLPHFDVSGWEPYMRDNFYIIDAAIAEFITNNQVVGVWKNSTLYVTDDVAVDAEDGSLWRATIDHTSFATGTFADDRARTHAWNRYNPSVGASEGLAVTPDQFGADPEFPDADATSAVQTALTEALTRSVPLQLDRMFVVNSPLTAPLDEFDTLRIRGNGGVLCTANLAGQPILSVTVTAETISEITLIDNTVTHDFGGQGNLTQCAKLTVPGHTLGAGRFCKVISNDPLVTGSACYKGEEVYIAAVVGDDLFTAARLKDTYTSGPRLAVHREGKKVFINEITVANDPDGVSVDGNQTMGLYLKGLVAPVIDNVTFKDISLSGVRTMGCVGASINRCNFNRGFNLIATKSIFGYGVDDRCSEQTQIYAPRVSDCRHGYTTNVVTTNVSDPWTYGQTRQSVVSAGTASQCSSTPWDTHDLCERITFVGCKSLSVYQGQDVAYGGFQLRGKGHRVIQCEHNGGGVGVQIDTDNANVALTIADQHIIQNFVYDGNAQAIRMNPGSHPGPLFAHVSQINSRTSYQFGAISVYKGTMVVEDANLVFLSDQPTVRAFDLRGDGHLDVSNVLMDYTGLTGADPSVQHAYVMRYDGANNVFNISDGEVKAGSPMWDMVHWAGAGTVQDVTIVADLVADKSPANYDGILSVGAGSNIRRNILVNLGRSGNSAYGQDNLSVAGSYQINTNGCFSPTVTRAFVVSTTGISINGIGIGEFVGQRMVILNLPGSSQSLLLDATPGNRLSLLADLTLDPGAGTALVWNGQTWLGYSASITAGAGTGVTDHGALTGLTDDDHPQYLTDARGLSFLGFRILEDIGDVPVRGTPGTALRVAPTGPNHVYRMPGWDDPARDVIKLAPSTHDAGTTGFADATASVYAMAGAATKTALRLFSGTSKGVWLEVRNHALALLMDMKQSSADLFEMRWRDAAGLVKGYLGSTFQVLGGDSTDRSGSSQVTIKGNLHVDTITGPTDPGDYTAPYIIGQVRLWDDGIGLRQKRAADPSSATDGLPL